MRRSICTSEPRRASTRVSSGFTLFEHSSPSFGSHRTRSDRNGAESATVRRRCAAERPAVLVSFTFVEPLCRDLPRTRAHARLLGPCFKTGPMRPDPSASPSPRRGRSAAHPRRVGASGTSVDEGDSTRGVGGTAGDDGRRDGTGRLVAPRPNPPCRTPVRAAASGVGRPHGLGSARFHALLNSLFKVLFIFPSRYLFAIGLAPVSSLGWSLPPVFGLQSQTTRLSDGDRPAAPVGPSRTGFSPSPTLPSKRLGGRRLRRDRFPRSTTRTTAGPRDSNRGPVPASLAVTEGILVSFSSSA